jgi:hypothetical protein
MTANARIDVQTAKNALVVPVAALSFQPPAGSFGTHRRTAQTVATPAAGAPASPWGATTGSAATALAGGSQGRIFVLRDGKLVRVPVGLTLVTTTQAAVVPRTGATLAAGDAVVTGDSSTATGTHAQRAATSSQNPLLGAPQGGVRMPRSS